MPTWFHDTEDPSRVRSSLRQASEFIDDMMNNRWLPAGAFINGSGTSTGLVDSQRWTGITYPDAASTYASANLWVPSSWVSGSCVFSVVIGNSTANSGNVRINVIAGAFGSAESTNSAGVNLLLTTAVPSQYQTKVVEFDTTSVAVNAGDEWLGVRFARIGADAADTFADTMVMLGVLVKFRPTI